MLRNKHKHAKVKTCNLQPMYSFFNSMGNIFGYASKKKRLDRKVINSFVLESGYMQVYV